MTNVEAYLDDLAATGKFGQIPSINGPTMPLKIVKMTRIENNQISIEALDEQWHHHTVIVGF